MTAENYHLKWDSHLSFLNSSVATLYKNEKFADVVLYSSNSNNGNSDIPTVGISAHKFILSSCSLFFATMFETAPITAPNGIMYVVLPPDLSYRAIQILVQYMYSGEATVSNDILNEVLRGGEILKIRGLCRSSTSTSSHHHHHHLSQLQPQRETMGGHYASGGTRSSILPTMTHTQLPNDMYINKCAPGGSGSGSGSCAPTRYSMEHHQLSQHHQFRGLGASVMPKDSPVIVKSPKLSQLGLLAPVSAAVSKHHHTGGGGGGGISVNKEVAIDPEEKCCYQAQQQEPPPPPMNICTEVGCSSCPMAAVETIEPMRRHRQRSSNHSDEQQPRHDRDYLDRPPDEHMICEREDLVMAFDRRSRRESACDRVNDYFVPEHFENANINNKPYGEASLATTSATTSRLPLSPPLPHNFLNIKQEPADWSSTSTTGDSNSGSIDNLQHRSVISPILHSPKQPLDFKMPLCSAAVKMETNITNNETMNEEDDDNDDEDDKLRDYNNFKLLVCDICQKSFDDTKTLVRHLETHATDNGGGGGSGSSSSAATITAGNCETLTKSYVPKKRRRISQQENNSIDHVTLLCDLCSTSFETPAEWVRHMNNQHTEIELAMFNSKKDNEHKTNMSASVNNNNNNISNSNNNNNNGTITCTATSSNSQQQHHQHQHHQPQQMHNKKYTSRQTVMLHKRHATSRTHSPIGSIGNVQCGEQCN